MEEHVGYTYEVLKQILKFTAIFLFLSWFFIKILQEHPILKFCPDNFFFKFSSDLEK